MNTAYAVLVLILFVMMIVLVGLIIVLMAREIYKAWK